MTMTVGELVRAGRRSQGISQRELARRAGVSQATICAIERERTAASLATMGRIAGALNKQFVIEMLPTDAPSAAEMANDLARCRDVARVFITALGDLADQAYIMTGSPWAEDWDRIRAAGQYPDVRLKLVLTVNDVGGGDGDNPLSTIRKAAAIAEAMAKVRVSPSKQMCE